MGIGQGGTSDQLLSQQQSDTKVFCRIEKISSEPASQRRRVQRQLWKTPQASKPTKRKRIRRLYLWNFCGIIIIIKKYKLVTDYDYVHPASLLWAYLSTDTPTKELFVQPTKDLRFNLWSPNFELFFHSISYSILPVLNIGDIWWQTINCVFQDCC